MYSRLNKTYEVKRENSYPDKNYIPKVIYMTYDDIASIPQYVFNNINNDCDHLGFKCKIVDKDGKKFFNTRYKDFKDWKKK